MNDKEEKKEFITSVSHEIRTVLNTIVGLSEDISEYEDIPEEIMEDAEDLKTASQTLFELIDNVLEYISLENGKAEILNKPYNPRELFEEIAKIDEEYIGDKTIYIHTDIDNNIPYELIGDKKSVEKIVNNLLTNAIKYTDGGDIWFDVKTSSDDENCDLTIRIKDTGRGMRPDQLERLFNKFKKLNVERNTTTEGTGLGLAVTKSLVDLLGGEISVQSTYGEGSTFTVKFTQKIHLKEEPDLSRTQRLRLQKISYEEEGYGYKKVLIVDDNKLNIKVVRRILEQSDLIIEECYNGKECIDIINKDNDYDLILMDIMMPVMSGEETLKKLQEIDGFNTPVIALTADAEAGSEDKYENEGFADYIAKPFTKIEMEEKLDKVFKEKEILDEDKEY